MTTTTVSFVSVNVGDKLPSTEIPITSSLIVGGAIASRDFTTVHHDKKAAQAGGLPDVFMNILTSNGLMGSYVTNWAGVDATVKKIDLKLGAPNLPGFVMTLVGEVKAKDDASNTVDIEVVGENNVWGMHMAGTVKIQLPQ
ncbi:MaoC/PaaZ C-terminal domain-containing protein [Oceanicoccus sp. KOV_DT_Chl]|uniref:MaoC/PaaZ C-terminal domain-containing protein n=1 Tax=Oceanicoccus sp. KOV_DT_Chl TaxID=1904639 RepID=UPI001F17F34C|nr:MaoC/PaaZ C-terminal domain-containing protein [Oceanicoccus sp. KOV_DT_Chl]